MKKYDLVSALAEETAGKVAASEENWRGYLDTASRLYRYRFQDQLLIHAQRPDATACASMEIWNERMHCWVNQGAKGIALIDEQSSGKIKYVFDISDVHKNRRRGHFPNLWEMRKEHESLVLARLEELYGETDPAEDFSGRIQELAERIASDYTEEVASVMESIKKGSFLEKLDSAGLRTRICDTLSSGIAYTVLKRCGLDSTELKKGLDFPASGSSTPWIRCHSLAPVYLTFPDRFLWRPGGWSEIVN